MDPDNFQFTPPVTAALTSEKRLVSAACPLAGRFEADASGGVGCCATRWLGWAATSRVGMCEQAKRLYERPRRGAGVLVWSSRAVIGEDRVLAGCLQDGSSRALGIRWWRLTSRWSRTAGSVWRKLSSPRWSAERSERVVESSGGVLVGESESR
jgi:hypothetical protein